MEKMKTMTREDAKEISSEVRARIADYLKERGIALKKTGGSYDPMTGEYSMRFTFQVEAMEKKAAEMHVAAYGDLVKVKVGDKVSYHGRVLGTLKDISSGGCPIITAENGKAYRFKTKVLTELVAVA